MLFNSIHFLFFYPIVVFVYFILPHKKRWIWLLFSSYYFYMSWNPIYALLMAASTVTTYLSGLLISRSNRESEKKREFHRRLWVTLSFVFNLSILFLYKYFYFAVENINSFFSIIGMEAIQPKFDVVLPVGISFYTFQALSYTMDVFRGDIYAEKNIAKYALFVSFFPQLVAGPIERSKNLLIQINERHIFNYDNAKNGLILMAWGFFQKLVIADRAAILVNTVFDDYQLYSGFQIVVAVLFFAVQIYCDFSAYTDIAKGAAQIIGFRLMDNFKQPYFATSVQDFWRCWHISLSTWFRDYLYIPLGGSRCSTPRRYFNILITFLVSGLWHGASWNFVIWGGLNGMYQIIGDFLKPHKDAIYDKLRVRTDVFSFRFGKTLVTFLLVNFTWIFFRASDVGVAFQIIARMLSEFNPWVFFDDSLCTMGLNYREYHIAIASILVLFIYDFISRSHSIFEKLSMQNALFRWLLYTTLVLSILIFGVYGTDYVQTQFIYFQF